MYMYIYMYICIYTCSFIYYIHYICDPENYTETCTKEIYVCATVRARKFINKYRYIETRGSAASVGVLQFVAARLQSVCSSVLQCVALRCTDKLQVSTSTSCWSVFCFGSEDGPVASQYFASFMCRDSGIHVP